MCSGGYRQSWKTKPSLTYEYRYNYERDWLLYFLTNMVLTPSPQVVFYPLSHFSNFHLEIHLVTIYVKQLTSVPVGDTNNEETNIVNRTENFCLKKTQLDGG